MAKKRRRQESKKRRQRASTLRPAPVLTSSSVTLADPNREGEYDHVGRDMRQILVITASFVAAQLVLWQVFSQTGIELKLVELLRI